MLSRSLRQPPARLASIFALMALAAACSGPTAPANQAATEAPTAQATAVPLSSAGAPLSVAAPTPVPMPDVDTYTMREIPLPDGQTAPHDVWIGPDGMVWTSNQASNSISRFDPKSATFRAWSVPTPNASPLGLTVDYRNHVWFTEIDANKIGMFDPATERFQEWSVPTPASQPNSIIADGNGLWIQAPPQANGVWFTEQAGNKVGYLDSATGQFAEYPIPTEDSSA